MHLSFISTFSSTSADPTTNPKKEHSLHLGTNIIYFIMVNTFLSIYRLAQMTQGTKLNCHIGYICSNLCNTWLIMYPRRSICIFSELQSKKLCKHSGLCNLPWLIEVHLGCTLKHMTIHTTKICSRTLACDCNYPQ